MILGRRDVPLNRDASARFLPWLIGFMVYLATLALAGAIAVSNLAGHWDKGLSSQMTVQVPPPADSASGGAAGGGDAPDDQAARVEAVLDILRETPGVRRAEPVSEARMRELLRPWLGESGLGADLPLPTLIAVTVDRADPPDQAALRESLRRVAPGSAVDDHRRTLGQLLDVARSLRLLAILVVGLVAGAAVLTVVFVTRTGLAVHRQVIELLHLVGAHDGYVARQFQSHALRLGLLGGLAGLALAAATLYALTLTSAGAMLPPELAPRPAQLAMLSATPVATALVAMLTARVTVLRTLSRLA